MAADRVAPMSPFRDHPDQWDRKDQEENKVPVENRGQWVPAASKEIPDAPVL